MALDYNLYTCSVAPLLVLDKQEWRYCPLIILFPIVTLAFLILYLLFVLDKIPFASTFNNAHILPCAWAPTDLWRLCHLSPLITTRMSLSKASEVTEEKRRKTMHSRGQASRLASVSLSHITKDWQSPFSFTKELKTTTQASLFILY